MKFGVFIFATDLAMDPADLAVAAEERGFESFFVPEHVHMPVERETPVPTVGGRLTTRGSTAESTTPSSPSARPPAQPLRSVSAPASASSPSMNQSPWPSRSPLWT